MEKKILKYNMAFSRQEFFFPYKFIPQVQEIYFHNGDILMHRKPS